MSTISVFIPCIFSQICQSNGNIFSANDRLWVRTYRRRLEKRNGRRRNGFSRFPPKSNTVALFGSIIMDYNTAAILGYNRTAGTKGCLGRHDAIKVQFQECSKRGREMIYAMLPVVQYRNTVQYVFGTSV